MLTEDSTVLEAPHSQFAQPPDDSSPRDGSMLDESVIIPRNMQSMSLESLEQMYGELTALVRKDKALLDEKRKEQTMAFESFERLTFLQKYVRRNSKTRKGISNDIYSYSTEIAEIAQRIQRHKSKLRVLDALAQTMHLNAHLKEKHKKWLEGSKHCQVGAGEVQPGDSIFVMECRLALGSLCFALTIRLLGRFILSNRKILDPYDSEKDFYEAANRVKRRLIYVAQACDETRTAALPAADRMEEQRRINSLTDSAYASEIFMLAGVDDWNISTDDESRAVGIYSYGLDKLRLRRAREESLALARADEDTARLSGQRDRLEIDVAELVQIDRAVFTDQIGVSKLNLQLLKKALDEKYKRYDEMSVPQKFFRRKSITKSLIAKEIFNQSLQIKLLWDELRYWKLELQRLDEIRIACVAVLRPATLRGLQQHGEFARSNFDGLQAALSSGTCEDVHQESGYSCAEISDMISAYDIAVNKLAESVNGVSEDAPPTQRARSAVSNDQAPLFLDDLNEEDDGGIDIDDHVSEAVISYGEPTQADMLELAEEPPLPPAACPEALEAAVQAAQTLLERIPLGFVYRMSYARLKNELNLKKSERRKAGLGLGVMHFNGFYVNEVAKCEGANDINHTLVQTARCCDEARIHALPDEERQEEIALLMEMSDLAYAGRLLVLAEVQGWNLTTREQKLFIEEASRVEKRRRALSSDLLVKQIPVEPENRISPI